MARTARILLLAVLALGLTAGVGEAKSKRTAWMGVYTQSVDRELALDLKLENRRGALISAVVGDSPAKEAGLKKNDVIIAVDGKPIDDADDLTEAISAHADGDEITVRIVRDGSEQDVKVTLESRRRGDVVFWSWDDNPPKARAYAEALDSYRVHGSRGYLGVRVSDLSAQLGHYFGVEKGRGALVTEVTKGSPAESAGVRAGDVIVAIDDETVYDSRDVTSLVRESEKGEEVSIRVIRDKKELTLSATIEEEEGRDYGLFRLPDLPDVNVNLPQMRGLRFGDTRGYFDSDEFRVEMDRLREELEVLKKELKELRFEQHEQ